ncbi:MAG TPA: CDP-diacylglycerol--serine O-phosphatidyltransferase [Bacillota bacterium]|nr:CDP-diacylglycerol--serine O-phosphatidyltransferase [Bacillota bacterium]
MNTKMIPSIFTLANLMLGVLSLMYTMDGEWQMAAIMILTGTVLDAMDGRLARRLDATSPFGKELDSLCDLVSFGVAPALLIYAYKLSDLQYVGIPLALIFSLCGAVRLARFNVLNISDYFVGVPITAAGSLMALMVLLSNRIPDLAFPILMLLLAYLMVSRIKVPKY